MNLVDWLFVVFSILTLGGGVLMIFSRHPVTAAMYMIVSMLGVAALFVLLDAFFLAVLQVLVYAGAVMVLFLFIIMLLDVGPQGGTAARLAWLPGLAGVLATFLLGLLLLSFIPDASTGSGSWPALPESTYVNGQNLNFSTAVSAFGYGLFTKYMLPLQVAGFMLLAAMVGVIILSKKHNPQS